MEQAAITQYISETFADVTVVVGSKEAGTPEIAWDDSFFSYKSDQQFPFATIVTKDYGDFDNASNLNRPSVFRLNIGVGKETFRRLFGAPSEDATTAARYDFAALDHIMPHPVYGRMYWVCVLNPSEATFDAVRPLLAEAYEMAVKRYSKKQPAGDPV